MQTSRGLLVSLICLMTSLFLPLQARRGSVSSSAISVPAVDPEVAAIADQYREVGMVLEKGKRDAAQVQREALRSIDDTQDRAQRQQSRNSRRDAEKARRDAERKMVAERKARERAEEIRRQAEADSARIIREAEQRALDVRAKLEAQEAYDKAHSKPPITTEWQTAIKRDFEVDTTFIKNVILEGETSRLEKQDFVALFDEQKQWFDEQVGLTEHYFDESFKAVMKKKDGLAVLADGQRQADDLIAQLVYDYHLSEEVHKQLRVAALYEINAYLQQEGRQEIFMPSDVIRSLVDTVAEMVSPGRKSVTITTEKEQIERLEQRISELEQGRLSRAMMPPEESVVVKEELPTGPVAQEEHQALLAKITEEKDAAIRQLEQAAAEKMTALLDERDQEMERLRQDSAAEVAALRREKEAAVTKLRQETEEMLVYEREERTALVKALRERSSELFKLQDAVDQLKFESDQQKRQYDRERGQLTASLTEKQKEKVAIEADLGALSEQLRLLSTISEERLVTLANKVSQSTVQHEHLQRLLERKSREKVELEASLAQVQGQLSQLHQGVEELSAVSEQHSEQSQERFGVVQEQLAEKKRQNSELEALLQSMDNRLNAAVSVLRKGANECAIMEQRNSSLTERFAALRAQVSSISERLENASVDQVPALREELLSALCGACEGASELRQVALQQQADIAAEQEQALPLSTEADTAEAEQPAEEAATTDDVASDENEIEFSPSEEGTDYDMASEEALGEDNSLLPVQQDAPSQNADNSAVLEKLETYLDKLGKEQAQVSDAVQSLVSINQKLEQVLGTLTPAEAQPSAAVDVQQMQESAQALYQALNAMEQVPVVTSVPRRTALRPAVVPVKILPMTAQE